MQWQIPINVVVNVKMADGIVVLWTHRGSPRRSWCLGHLLVAALSSGLSFYNEDSLINFIAYILIG